MPLTDISQSFKSAAKAFGTGQTKEERDKFEKETSRDLVKVSNQMLVMQKLIQDNVDSLDDAVRGDSDKKVKLAQTIDNLNNVEVIQKKIVDGQELTQKEARRFVELSSQITGSLNDLNLKFEVNFAEVIDNLKSTLTDTSQDIEDRRELVRQIRDLAKDKGVDDSTVEGLNKLLDSNLNFTEEQTKSVEKLVNEVTKDKAFQSKTISTFDGINKSLDAAVLTQSELQSLLQKQDESGKSFTQRFIENPGIFAAQNDIKTGAVSGLLGAAGLGGLDTALGLSEKISLEGAAKGIEGAKGFGKKVKGFFGEKQIDVVDDKKAEKIIKKAKKDPPAIDGESKELQNISSGIDKLVEKSDDDVLSNSERNKERQRKKFQKQQLKAIKANKPKENLFSEDKSKSILPEKKQKKGGDFSLKGLKKQIRGFGGIVKNVGSSLGGNIGKMLPLITSVAKFAGPIALAAGVGVAAFKGTQKLVSFLSGGDKKFKDKNLIEKAATIAGGKGGEFLHDAINKGKTAKSIRVTTQMNLGELIDAKKRLNEQLSNGRNLKQSERDRILQQIKTASKFIKKLRVKQAKIQQEPDTQLSGVDSGGVATIKDETINIRTDGMKVIETESEKQIKQQKESSQQQSGGQIIPISNDTKPKQDRGSGIDDVGLAIVNSMVLE